MRNGITPNDSTNYISFDGYTAATSNAKLQRVAADGSITLSGRKYFARELRRFIGSHVRAFLDVDEAFAVCFTPFRRYICNATNHELWEALLKEAGRLNADC